MKISTNIKNIDFDGATVVRAENVGRDLVVDFEGCTLLASQPTDLEPSSIKQVEVTFQSVSDQVCTMHKGQGVTESIEAFPPLNTVETFSISGDLYEFGGYLNNEPWSVWQFRAASCATRWSTVNKSKHAEL